MLNRKISDPIELAIPADRKMLIVIRLTTAGVLARAGLGVDRMEDVKLAAEEACLCLMEQEAGTSRINVTFGREDGQFLLFAERKCEERGGENPVREAEVVKSLLETLADEVEVETSGGVISAIRIGLNIG